MIVDCIACEGIAPLQLEAWDQPVDHCKSYGALLPDGMTMPLGNDEAIAITRAKHMAAELQEGRLQPSSSWDGGLGLSADFD